MPQQEIRRNLNTIEVFVFIPHDAPFANKATNFSGHGLLTVDDGGQAGLITDDLHSVVVDADRMMVSHRGLMRSTAASS